MKLGTINLDEIKVVIFDFDDTLAIHKDKDFANHRNETEEKFLNFYSNAYLNSNCFYDSIEPCTKSEVLYDFINDLRNKNIKMYCLSGMKFSFHLPAKQSFLDRNYGKGIEVIATSSQRLKLDGVKIISKINNCALNEILFIDDREDVIELLIQNGINGIIASELKL